MESLEFSIPKEIYKAHLKDINSVNFTQREIEIISFLLSGRSSKRIALFFSISPKTVENHTRNIMGKLGCNSREAIIDFIEKSESFWLVKKYYSNLLIYSEFESTLKTLAPLKEKPFFLTIHCQSQEIMLSLLPSLEEHLRLLEINLKMRVHEKLESFFSFKKIENDNSQNLNILLVSQETPPHLLGSDCFELSQYKNYYFLVFELIKRFLPRQKVEAAIHSFQDKFESLESALEQKKRLPNPLEKPQIFRKGHFKSTQTIFKKLSWCLGALFLGTGVGGVGLFLFKDKPEPHIQSDLALPHESVFLKREKLLNQIKNKFKDHDGIQTLALVGIGGAGKTTIARQYARLRRPSVAWEINAESHENILNSFESLAYALSKTEEEKKVVRGFNEIKNQEKRTQQLFQLIEGKLKIFPSWLLLYDNAVNVNEVWKYFPKNAETRKRGKIIVTTRDSNMQTNNRISQIIQVQELTEDEKLDLFLKIMKVDTSQPFTKTQIEEAKKFLKHLPPFPLDISTAAYYLKATNTSYNHYLDHLKQPSDDFTEIQENILGDTSDYTKSRYRIISMPLKCLLESNKGYYKLLLLMSLLDASYIPRDLLEELLDDISLDKFVISLKRYSLISSENHPNILQVSAYSLHRSTQTILLAYLAKVLKLENNPNLLQEVLEAFLNYTARSIETEDFERMKILLPHCETLINHKIALKFILRTDLEYALGCMYFYLGKYPEAKSLLSQNLQHLLISEKTTNLWNLRALTYLGAVNINLGKQEESKKYLGHAIKGYKESFPQSYAGQAQALRYLATVYRDLGDYKAAKELFEESLSIYQGHLSKNYVGIARALGYVGDIYRELGDFERAKEFLEHSYAIHKAYFPDNKLGIIWNLAHLGEIYGILGDCDKAKSVLEESLQICKDYLSENHAYYPWISGCLGTAYCQLGRYEEAKEHLTHSASLFQKNFKENDVYYAWAIWHLGVVYGELKDFKKAKALLYESLKCSEKEYGKEHVEAGLILHALARAHLLEGDLSQAEDLVNISNNILQKQKHAHLYMSYETLAEICITKSLEAQRKGNNVQSQEYRMKARETLETALNVVKLHFRENSPFLSKIAIKLQKLNENYL